MLDMASDRVTTMVLVMVLTKFYPAYLKHFIFLCGLDFASHFVLMYSSLAVGASSHKTVAKEKNFLMWVYYTVPYAMFVTCVSAEAFYCSLYMWHAFPSSPVVSLVGRTFVLWELLVYVSAPLFFVKQVVNVIQMCEAFADLAEMDMAANAKKRKNE